MSEVRLNVIDSRDTLHGTVHGSIADAVIASLSAEPETIDELDSALDRFNKRIEPLAPFIWFDDGKNTDPWDAGVVVVDLAARIVAAESSCSEVLAEGEVNYHDGNKATDTWLRYKLPDDWLILNSVLEYESLREERRALRAANPPFDTRQVLYGSPLIEFIVSGCSAAITTPGEFAGSECHSEPYDHSESEDDEQHERPARNDAVLRALHTRWLITTRDDLGGRTPREVVLAKRSFIDADLGFRELQWSLLNEGPQPLSRDSAAYRFAGFGTHEFVVYYYLVRHLLTECWQRLGQRLPDKDAQSGRLSGATGFDQVDAGSESLEFSARPENQIQNLPGWLEQIAHGWLNSPSIEFNGRIPAAIIESERRRIPLVMSARDILIDENCELCRMLADETHDDFGPTFWPGWLGYG